MVENLRANRANPQLVEDVHFMPQWARCPYCSLNFTVHARQADDHLLGYMRKWELAISHHDYDDYD